MASQMTSHGYDNYNKIEFTFRRKGKMCLLTRLPSQVIMFFIMLSHILKSGINARPSFILSSVI